MDGSSWVGVIAFQLDRARVRGLPPTPAWGSFTEVNVRLYSVDEQGRRGVVFRSLEASSLPAVVAARAVFSLPYFWARTSQRPQEGGWEYASRRISPSPSRRGPRFQLGVTVDPTQTVRDELCAAAGLPGVVGRAPDSVLFSPGVSAKFGRGQMLDRM